MKFIDLSTDFSLDKLAPFLAQLDDHSNEIEKNVVDILSSIKENGFQALTEYSEKFDKYPLTKSNLAVKKIDLINKAKNINTELKNSLRLAIKNITQFHKKQKQKGFRIKKGSDYLTGQVVRPISSCCIYVPGGKALYPSSLLMAIIPAKIAGVKRIVVCSPPQTFENSVEMCFLLNEFGINEIYRLGGVQAVAAVSYGIDPVQKVDKIVGPGNAYVATAKRLLYGQVDIDMVAGPSEILIIADKTAKPEYMAADLLSQAEHDENARCILVTTEDISEKVLNAIQKQIKNLNKKAIAEQSLENNGLIIKTKNLKDSITVSNFLAPEHLEILTEKPLKLLKKLNHCGSVFLGDRTPEPVGDYFGGPNHILPTGNTARFFSPLGVYSFQKHFNFISYSRDRLDSDAEHIIRLAECEGLEAHANAVRIRQELP